MTLQFHGLRSDKGQFRSACHVRTMHCYVRGRAHAVPKLIFPTASARYGTRILRTDIIDHWHRAASMRRETRLHADWPEIP